jgi:hypothetical protein
VSAVLTGVKPLAAAAVIAIAYLAVVFLLIWKAAPRWPVTAGVSLTALVGAAWAAAASVLTGAPVLVVWPPATALATDRQSVAAGGWVLAAGAGVIWAGVLVRWAWRGRGQQ